MVAKVDTVSDLRLDVSQAHELKLAFRRAGWTNADIKKSCEGDMLFRILPVVRGHAEIKLIEHLIDLDVDPYVPDCWKVERHIKGGHFKFDPAQVTFYLSKKQKKGVIGGNDLKKELEKKPVFNANLLDYLLAHPDIIPDEWKTNEDGSTRYTFFWGTEYRDADGDLYVRYLHWSGDGWCWSGSWLDDDWVSDDPALLRAS